MRIKNLVYSLSIVLSTTLVGGLLPTNIANAASLSYAMNPSISTNKVLTSKETSQVESEINVLNNCHVATSLINRVNVTASGNEYILKYGDNDEKVMIKSNDTNGVTLIASDGKKSNVISLAKDGSIILDGHKVQISQANQINTNAAAPSNTNATVSSNTNAAAPSNTNAAAPSNTNVAVPSPQTIYKSVKSLYPYGGLQPSDYNQYLASGQQNIALGEHIDNITATALTILVGATDPFVAIVDSIATMVGAIMTLFDAQDPTTQYLGLAYTTYTAGDSDYKYVSKFYGNVACTGTYYQQLSYEHFTVY